VGVEARSLLGADGVGHGRDQLLQAVWVHDLPFT
jgi:hypothetical protein